MAEHGSAVDIDNSLFFDGISLDGWRASVDSDLRRGNVDAAIATAQGKLEEAKKSGNNAGHAVAALAVAQASIWAGKTQQALDNIVEAQGLYNAVGSDEDNAVAKHVLARVHLLGKLFDDAFEAATDALALFKKSGAKLGEASVLNTLAICELMRQNADPCLQRAEASLDLFRECGEVRGQASAMHTKAILYTAADEKAEGVRQSQAAAKLLKESGDERRYVAACVAVSEFALQLGDSPDAIDASQDALECLEKLGDKNGQVTVLLSLGGMYFNQEMYVKGIDTTNNIISLCKDIGDKKHEAQAWFMNAQLKRAKSAVGGLQWPPKQGISPEDLEDMQKSAQTAVDLFEEIGDAEGEAGSRFELCHSFLAKSELDRGQKEIRLSQKKFSEIGDTRGECISTLIGGQVQSAMGEKELALSTMEKALGLAQEVSNTFLERACKEWMKKHESPKPEDKTKKEAAEPVAMSEQGGIAPATYAQCIHRSMTLGESTGEHFFENPTQTANLEGALGIRFPFFRNRPPPGKEFDPTACIEAWKEPPTKPRVKLVASSGKAAATQSQITPGVDLKKPRLPPMAVPPPKTQPANARVVGSDILGGRLPEVPQDVHNDMVALASKGEIPVTKPEDRAVFITKRPTFYGDPIFRDALRFGYIHPTANQHPRGMKWKSVRAGAFKLVAVAA